MRTKLDFAGAAVLITGGASGIGFALGAELVRLGARVTLADVDGDAVTAAAERLGRSGTTPDQPSVRCIVLDVTDRAAVARAVDDVIDREGRIDLLVNNAGISIGGPTHELSAAHWDRAIEVNLTGAVNGIVAAYPHMVAAGRGQIVNTASAAGLVPPPFVAAYAAAKAGVIGLSLGLRSEAALHGVGVSVLCPAAVETPILDRLPPADLPPTVSAPVTPRAYLDALRQRPMAADAFARSALKLLARNRAVVVVPRSARPIWWMHRCSPALTGRLMRLLARRVDRRLVKAA